MRIFRSVFTVVLAASAVVVFAQDKPAAPKPAAHANADAPPPGPHYRVSRHINVGGEGGWDYLTVDPATHRVFVSHSTHVVVVDATKGAVIGDIPKTEGVHGIALASDLNRGFISNGRTSTMTIFELDSLKTVGEVKTTGERPDAILYEPVTKRVFTFNAGGKNATAFDASSTEVAGTIALGGKPEFAQADGRGMVFVNIEDTSEVAAIDAKSLTVTKRWKLEPCTEPSGLAIDREHHRLFSGCANRLMAISDYETGRIVATAPIGEGVDGNGFDAKRHVAFSANGGNGTLTVVAERGNDQYAVVDNVATKGGARTMAVDSSNGHVYVVTADFGPPPAPTAERPHPRPTIVPNTMELIEVVPDK